MPAVRRQGRDPSAAPAGVGRQPADCALVNCEPRRARASANGAGRHGPAHCAHELGSHAAERRRPLLCARRDASPDGKQGVPQARVAVHIRVPRAERAALAVHDGRVVAQVARAARELARLASRGRRAQGGVGAQRLHRGRDRRALRALSLRPGPSTQG